MNDMYRRGYNSGYVTGYRKGVTEGLQGSEAKLVMAHDLEFIYGTMCLVLKKNYLWEPEAIQSFCEEIQAEWDEIGKDANNSDERMAELVLRETGVPLMQMTEEILNDGMEEYECQK